MENTTDIDIVDHLQWLANSAKPMDAAAMRLAAAEIVRLRLTDAEREAVIAAWVEEREGSMGPFCWAVACDGECYGTCDTEGDARERWAALTEAAPEREFNVIRLFAEPGCHVFAQKNLTLTDAEREAVKWAVSAAEDCQHPADDTLRGLLERTK